MNKRIKTTIILSSLIIALILIDFIIIRLILPSQIDDVTPSRLCDDKLLDKSEVLMVIPLRENQSIADNPVWCEHIRGLNKTIGMHGVYHTEKEFMHARDENYIRIGMEEFYKCFGFYPTIFEAPQFSLSEENEKTLREMNFTILKSPRQITHKVYHCTDYENKSWLVKLNYLNKII
jgi:predicted deacetylase